MKRLFHLSIGDRGVRRDVASEIAFHIEMRERELRAAGVPPDEAHRRAVAAFGDVDAVEHTVRSERRRDVRTRAIREWGASVVQDIRHAGRTLARSPGFTLAALATLALGIGANSAIFSMVDGALLRPPPYANAARLLVIQRPLATLGIDDIGFSAKDVADFRSDVHSLDGVAEYHSMSFDLLGHGDPRRVQVGVVSAGFFQLLGVTPLLGRTFAPGEDQPGAAPVLLLSYDFWRSQLGADSSIVGQTFRMNDREHLVIGVLPPLPRYPDQNDLYMPVSSCPFRSSPRMANDRAMRMVGMVGLMRPGVTRAQVQRDLATEDQRLHTAYPEAFTHAQTATIASTPVRTAMGKDARTAFLVLLGITGLVLLVACANVAHLTLARHLRREREMAVRTALGAGRARLLRLLVTESLLLSLGGAALGLLLAGIAMHPLAGVAARFTPRAGEIVLDGRVVAFALALAVVTGIVFGVVPAFADTDALATKLRDGGASSSGRRRTRLRALLVVGEVAVAFVVLLGAGLMLRDLRQLLGRRTGYDPQHVVTAHVDLNFTTYASNSAQDQFEETLLQRLRATPGVVSAAIANAFPASSGSPQNRTAITIRGPAVADSASLPKPEVDFVSPDYFRTIGTPLLRGRDFAETDRDTIAQVAIISHSAALHWFGHTDPIGRMISADGQHWVTIVGEVGDVRQFGPAADVPEQAYVPIVHQGISDFRVLVRSLQAPAGVGALVRTTVQAINPEQPVIGVRTLEQARNEVMASSRLTAILLTLFAALALVIAAAGLGGVMAYAVGQRTQEFGIRMALGAKRSGILWLVVGQGVRLVVVGLVIGALAFRLVAHAIGRLLYGVSPTDPLTYAAVALVFLLVAVLACLLPARRATTVDPIVAFKAS
jgi:putative ABC transport system permease protein